MTAEQKAHSTIHEVVDVLKLDATHPEAAIRSIKSATPVQKIAGDLLIIGGGTGGVAAALAATRKEQKIKVCLTEETDWIGGQMTAQGVSALDENYLVETSGACKSYQDFRNALRDYYKTQTTMTTDASSQTRLNPGSCWVTRLAFEPKVAVEYLQAQLKPSEDAGRLATYVRFKPVYVNASTKKDKTTINAVGMVNLDTGDIVEFHARLFIDATELGDLLPLAGVPYSSGSDSNEITHESHAPKVGDPENVQDFTYPFVVEYRPGEHHVIEKPDRYDEFNKRGKFSFQGYKMFGTAMRVEENGEQRELLPFWHYRRLIDKSLFSDSRYQFDVAMINWDSNDLRGENIIDKSALVQAERLAMGKLVSLGFLYWLQTEAARDDGGKGYPELMLRTDVLGTLDGLSKYPYIRESRRIHAFKTIVEQDVVTAFNSGARAKNFPDSVGIGLYPVDIHGFQEVPGAGQETRPFQIPLSALIPVAVTNLLPSCKNIGTTHITNGAYRLHPIEWAIGEAQGTLSRFLLGTEHDAANVLQIPELRKKIQLELIEGGAPAYWFDDIATDHPNFVAIQFVATAGIFGGSDQDLHFLPEELVTKVEAAEALSRLYGQDNQPPGDDGGGLASGAFVRSFLIEKLGITKHLPDLPEETFTRSDFANFLFLHSKGQKRVHVSSS